MLLSLLKKHFLETILVIFAAIFSIWLMFSTFGYSNGQMHIAGKAWSDFANHIPLIRSFSFGYNIPPQDPLFAEEPIRYHFLFYMLVGFLEKIGVRLDYALNIPSAIGFFGLLYMLYYFGKNIFQSKAVGILSVLFLVFNGSLSFTYFFKKHPLSLHSAQDVIANTTFPSFGPYGKGIVSAFWNLNIYTNQRHLAAAFALSLLMISIFLFHTFERKKPHIAIAALVGVVLGLSFFFHLAVFLMTAIVIAGFFLLFSELRLASVIALITAAAIAYPQYLYMKSGGSGGYPLTFAPGYLIKDNLNFANSFNYWFYNFGLHLILIPVGFILAPRNLKKLLLACIPLFLIGNLFQFEPEMAANHKFFNYFLLIGSLFSAFALVTVWRKNMYARVLVVIVFFFLVLSGIIDFFPVYNDSKIALADYPVNKDVLWIMNNTPPQTTFLNTQYLYDTASMAGRKIYLGWPYFPWSSGFDTTKRSNEIRDILAEADSRRVCAYLMKNNLDYVSITTPSSDIPFDPA